MNWAAIAPLLTDRYRVIAPDLAGHGLTRSGGRGCDVASNRALLHAFLESVSADPVILMGNSMGGMITLLETSAALERVSRLILVDPALPFVPARLDLRSRRCSRSERSHGSAVYCSAGRVRCSRRRWSPRC